MSNIRVRSGFAIWTTVLMALATSACNNGDQKCEYPNCVEPICTSACDDYEFFGLCDRKTTRCCTDRDCPVGTCDESTGYCREYEICHCTDDMECPPPTVCRTHYSDCGFCIAPPPTCTEDTDCATGSYCKDGTYCQEHCCD